MKNNYIICKEHNKQKFIKLGYNLFCELKDMKFNDTIAFDFETDGLFALENDVFCCQIGNGVDSNYLIVLYDDNFTFYDVIPYLKGKTFVMQNGLFDLGFMYKHRFIPEKVFDTMLASKILYNGQLENYITKKGITVKVPVRHDFKSIMEREIGVLYDKTSQKNIHLVKLSKATAIEYSFNDVDRLLEAHDALVKKLESNNQMPTYNLHCRFIKALAYMEQCGLPVSREAWKKKMKIDADNAQKYKEKIGNYICEHLPEYKDEQLDLFNTEKNVTFLNLNSPVQMIPVFKKLDINVTGKDGKQSIQEDVITKTKHEFVDMWLEYQEANHRVTTFGSKIYKQIKENDRIYTNFNPMVDTARLSSRKGSINFLNFPSDQMTRSCFEAKKGRKMVVCDWSGQVSAI